MSDLAPETREEAYLSALASDGTVNLEPKTRKEALLQCAINGTLPSFEPETREEAYLVEVCKKIAGGGSGGGLDVEQIDEIVEALFANGDMVITAPDGKLYKNVTIEKPDTLIPENIAKDVNIAGVVGTHSGGGEGENDKFKMFVEGTMTEIFDDNVANIGSSTFCYNKQITKVSFPACTKIGSNAFYFCEGLTNVDFPVCESIYQSAFNSCKVLLSAYFPTCKSIGMGAFTACVNLTNADFPECKDIGISAFFGCTLLNSANFPMCERISASGFANCKSLSYVYFPKCTNIGSRCFNNCSLLKTVIFEAPSVCELSASNAFAGTPIASGSGYFYVPASLVAAYKSATNWTYYSAQISARENMPS